MHDISRARRASRRRSAAVLITLLFSLGTVAGPAGAVSDGVAHHKSWSKRGKVLRMWDDGYSVNVAHVVNTGKGKEKSKVRAALVRTDDRRISAINVARAHAVCRDCRSVAVAFEVVLADNEPRRMNFHNEAIADNRRCTRCETVAMAYQIAVVAPDVALTRDGVRQLRDISAQIDHVAASDLPIEEVVSTVEALVAQAMVVLQDELYQGRPGMDASGATMSTASSAPSIVLRSDVDRP